MKITYKKGKGDKIHLYCDGEYTLTVDEVFFHSLSINNEEEMTSSELSHIAEKIGERRAYNYAVSLLSRREHTAFEITDKLIHKGYGQYASAVSQKLIDQGYLSDERFAYLYVKELVNLKNYGKKRITQELIRKGVSRDIIETVMSEAEFPESRLRELIEKKYSRYLDTEKGVQKTVNALLRLGYSYSEIRDVLKEIAENEEFCEVMYE